ncbi:hypothetical protein CONPUDRAFT_99159 [Coniophora puteana RWD-64-598 SS2]|uniref:Protein ARV n=1 Tax=Coniophora puteana (strain RWD-64-598) TaxID=741705 RepID=A0A5M3MWW0_CONPW|nr:uncharacterized protein CONPUDRAFT_99159 [Coniophora puteana RWD-64-598 SS2]EIW83628.1 hypothetical protein CONPUDRAFT_99159 [Coniophora puteana RWD-64-598 SS2]
MPVCILCAHPMPHVYTEYESADNLRLEQCTSCRQLADPYIKRGALTKFIDVVLLKREVYRHLLFNRGAEPRRVITGIPRSRAPVVHEISLQERWWLIMRLGMGLIVVDAYIRWSHLLENHGFESRVSQDSMLFLKVFLGCLIETLTFHCGTVFASLCVLRFLEFARTRMFRSKGPVSGVRQQFRFSLIPLTIFYSSITKLFLLFLLTLYPPSGHVTSEGAARLQDLCQTDPLRCLYEMFDEDKLDREWVVRNVWGGMAAGFGLKVVLDCHPVFTTLVILAGWAVKTTVAELVKDWVGVDDQDKDLWLAYSIP